MIPRKTSCEFVRISNLTQRMTKAEIENFTGRYKLSDVVKTEKGGACLPGKLWNDTIRPAMLENPFEGVNKPSVNHKDMRVTFSLPLYESGFVMMALVGIIANDNIPKGVRESADNVLVEIRRTLKIL